MSQSSRQYLIDCTHPHGVELDLDLDGGYFPHHILNRLRKKEYLPLEEDYEYTG